MKVLSVVLVLGLVGAGCAAPGSGSTTGPAAATEDEGRVELFSGVALEKDASGSDLLNVKFQPGELKEAARTFEEARGKIKKYAPLLAGLGVKVVAVVGLIFGALTLLVTKAVVVAKLAFLAAAALGIQKLISGGGFNGFGGNKQQGNPGWNSGSSSQPQWSAPAAQSSYPYARSSNVAQQDANDLAYKEQIAPQTFN